MQEGMCFFFLDIMFCNIHQLCTTTLLDLDHSTMSYLPFVLLPNRNHVLNNLLPTKFKEANKGLLFWVN